jgi:predicted Zn-dependent protease
VTNNPADYSRVESLVRNHQWDDGLQLLMPLLADNPRNVKALNLAGLAYTGKGDLQKADQYFESCLQVDPGFLPALKNLSVNEFNAHQYADAEKHLLAAEKELPDDPVVNLFLGQIEYRQQKFKLAAEHLDRARNLVLQDPNVTAYLAVSFLRTDQKPQALELLGRITPSDIDPQSQLAIGISLAEIDMYAEAIPYLQAAFNHDPDSYDTGFDLALACIRTKQYANAIAASNELVRRGHDTSELENVLAEASEDNGQTQQAVDAYRKAIALDSDDVNNYLDFALLCINHHSFADGMKVISVGLQVHPKSDRLIFMRGILNAMQDHFDLAEQDFREAALLAPQNDYGYVGLGVTYLERGNSNEAIRLIRSRLRQKSNDASLQYLLGEGLIRSGAAPGQPAYAEAQSALEKSVKLNPKLCLPHVSLGSIYLDEGRFSEAATQFELARAIDPNEKSSYSHLAVAYRHLGETEKAREALTALKQVLEQDRAGTRVKAQTTPEEEKP